LITHGENGMLVRSGDCVALSQAITAVLADEPLRARLSEAAKTSAERFSLGTLGKETAALIKENI
ncbi:MAG TPA: glycosyltransferase family 1 protein, partial [Candidatus Paceibacterota bacterium]|nr:glycosyltransferase family 1 protein [Candidatus Paceibacterota bacterium]